MRTFLARAIVALVIMGLSAALWSSRGHHAALRESVESLAEHLHSVHEEKAHLETALHEKDRHINTKETEVAIKARELQSLEAKLGGKEHLVSGLRGRSGAAGACRTWHGGQPCGGGGPLGTLPAHTPLPAPVPLPPASAPHRAPVPRLPASPPPCPQDAAYAEVQADAAACRRELAADASRVELVMRELAEERGIVKSLEERLATAERVNRERMAELERQLNEARARADMAAGAHGGQQQQQQQQAAAAAAAAQAQAQQGGQQQGGKQQGQQQGQAAGEIPKPGDQGGAVPSPLPVPIPSPQQQQQQQQPGQGVPSPSPMPQGQQGQAQAGGPGPVPSPTPQDGMPHHDHDPHDAHARHNRHRLSMLEEHMGMAHEDPHRDEHGRQHA